MKHFNRAFRTKIIVTENKGKGQKNPRRTRIEEWLIPVIIITIIIIICNTTTTSANDYNNKIIITKIYLYLTVRPAKFKSLFDLKSSPSVWIQGATSEYPATHLHVIK